MSFCLCCFVELKARGTLDLLLLLLEILGFLVCLREWLVVGAHFKVYPSNIAVIELMMGSFVQVNSVSIDLADAIGDKASTRKCQHFSIRGYVSEIRKKDWKKCWPFPVNESEKNPSLPPLDVPTYRCFGCESCHQESVTKDMDKDGQTDFNCCSSSCKSDTNCGKAAVKSLISSCQIYISLKGKIVKSMLLEGLAFLLNTQILSLQEKELILKCHIVCNMHECLIVGILRQSSINSKHVYEKIINSFQEIAGARIKEKPVEGIENLGSMKGYGEKTTKLSKAGTSMIYRWKLWNLWQRINTRVTSNMDMTSLRSNLLHKENMKRHVDLNYISLKVAGLDKLNRKSWNFP
ncbi:hypothetical protein HN51_032513 [Arachis hypogaea]